MHFRPAPTLSLACLFARQCRYNRIFKGIISCPHMSYFIFPLLVVLSPVYVCVNGCSNAVENLVTKRFTSPLIDFYRDQAFMLFLRIIIAIFLGDRTELSLTTRIVSVCGAENPINIFHHLIPFIVFALSADF